MNLDFDMGPYAGFVWPAYAVSALVLGGLAAAVVIRARRWKRALERLEAETPK